MYLPVLSADVCCKLCCAQSVVHWNWEGAVQSRVLFLRNSHTRDKPWAHWQANERISANVNTLRPVKQKYSLTRDIRQGAQARPFWRDEILTDKVGYERVSHFNICGRDGSVFSPVVWPNWPPCHEHRLFFQVTVVLSMYFFCLEHFSTDTCMWKPYSALNVTSSGTLYLTYLSQYSISLLPITSVGKSAYSLY